MKTSYLQHNERREPSLAMTPMIDVVFLLLIFFVCTASFEAIELTLPTNLLLSSGSAVEVPTEELPELEQVILTGTHLGGTTEWSVSDSPMASLDQLKQTLAALAGVDRNLPVILDAEGSVPLGDLIDVYDACRVAGFVSIRFAAAGE